MDSKNENCYENNKKEACVDTKFVQKYDKIINESSPRNQNFK